MEPWQDLRKRSPCSKCKQESQILHLFWLWEKYILLYSSTSEFSRDVPGVLEQSQCDFSAIKVLLLYRSLCHVHYGNHSFLSPNCETFLFLYTNGKTLIVFQNLADIIVYFFIDADLTLYKCLKDRVDEGKSVRIIHTMQ